MFESSTNYKNIPNCGSVLLNSNGQVSSVSLGYDYSGVRAQHISGDRPCKVAELQSALIKRLLAKKKRKRKK